jgi:hypothetical protein
MDVIWGKREGKYFLVTDWTGGIALIRFDKFAVWRNPWGGLAEGVTRRFSLALEPSTRGVVDITQDVRL